MKYFVFAMVALSLVSCNKEDKSKKSDFAWSKENPKPPSAPGYAMDSPLTVIKNATIMTANGPTLINGSIIMEKGLIKTVTKAEIQAPEGALIIDATGKFVTPGLIDVHSHMGVYANPSVKALHDGNEVNTPVSAHVWAEHGFWPQDPDIWRALAGGVTTVQILHGSANLIGGRSFTAKLLPKTGARQMRFKEAPQGVKFACGENPKRVYQKQQPNTRMGNMAGWRKTLQEAVEYEREWEKFRNGDSKEKIPKRDLAKETLVKVMKGELLVHWHCYKADDINNILDIALEFGFKIRTVHHGLEAYKLAPRLAKEDTSVATWSDWYGFKQEAYDGIPHNIALLQNAGARPIVHSDSAVDIRFLNVEAAKAMMAGRKLGLRITEEEALKWITLNPAWALGIEDKIGSIEEGKMADIVLWDGHPFSVKSKTTHVFINGKAVFDRAKEIHPLSDLEVGITDGKLHDGREFTTTKPLRELNLPDSKDRDKLSQIKINDSFVITNVNYFSPKGWVKNANLEVANGFIKNIGEDANTQLKSKVDGTGKFLTPGFIEAFSTLGLIEIDAEKIATDVWKGIDHGTPAFFAKDSLNLNNTRIPVTREEGITTTIASHRGGVIVGHGVAYDLNEKKNFIQSPVALFGELNKGYEGPSRSKMWRELRQLVIDSITYMKHKKDYLDNDLRKLKPSEQDLKAMIPVLNGQVPWVIEAHRASDIERILDFKKFINQKGYKPTFVISGASEAWMVADKLKKNKTTVMITPTAQTPQTYSQLRARFDQAAYLDNRGVNLILTTSADRFHVKRIRQELGMAVKYGMDPNRAILAATKTPGKVFNLKRGEIKTGAIANLVLWSGDPMEPTSWADKVWISGKDMDLENRQSKLARKYLKSQEK